MKVDVEESGAGEIDQSGLVRVAEAILRSEGIPELAELGIKLVGPEEMRQLNLRYRSVGMETDVISLPVWAGKEQILEQRAEVPVLLGDVIICPEVAEREAADFELPAAEMPVLALIHGILHLLGYDHVSRTDTAAMESRQSALLALAREVLLETS